MSDRQEEEAVLSGEAGHEENPSDPLDTEKEGRGDIEGVNEGDGQKEDEGEDEGETGQVEDNEHSNEVSQFTCMCIYVNVYKYM